MAVNSQTRRANMTQLRQAAPVASSFPFDDPALQLEDILPPAAPQLGMFGYQPTSIEIMESGQAPAFSPPAHYGMEHKASTKPYDPLSKYGLTNEEHLLDLFLGGDARKVKKAMETGEEPYDYFGQMKPVYDPAIEQAFVPLDLVAGAGMPRALQELGEFGLKHSPEVAERATRAFSGGLAGMKPTIEIMAGAKAKTADLEMLDKAKKALAAGESKEKVFSDTGWFKGVDDKWKFEISDIGSEFNQELFEKSIKRGTSPRSSYLLKHDELMKAYPELSFPVDPLKGETGANIGGGRIGLGTVGGGRSSMLHELQHGVQDIEGFARGGSMESFYPAVREIRRDADVAIGTYNEKIKNTLNMKDELKAKMYDEGVDREFLQKNIDKLDEKYQDLLGRRNKISSTYPHDLKELAYKKYRALAGEVEARNVQQRRDYAPKQRELLYPWLDQDVPADMQSVLFRKNMLDIVKMESENNKF